MTSGNPDDLPFMWDMLHEAIHRASDEPAPSREEVLSEPGISHYLEDWGRPGDAAVVARDGEAGRRIGAAWYRLMSTEDPGYGFVDAGTPEIAIAVAPGHRGRGVGEVLLRSLMDTAKRRNFHALSLSVQTANLTAIKLYERCGFEKLSESGGAWTMKIDFTISKGATTEHTPTLNVLEERLAVCRVDPASEVPDWAVTAPLFSVTRTADELSIVCPEELVPSGVKCETGWRCLKLAGSFEFSMVGVLLAVLGPLAEAGVGVFAVSTFDTDYVLVKEGQLDLAIGALRGSGHRVG